MSSWLLLVYKVPREPTAARVYVWRKLKRLGALLLHDAVWVLPLTPWTREQLQWLAVEVTDLGGEALLWESQMVLPGQDDTLIRRFIAEVDSIYGEILADLEQALAELAPLATRYQQAQAQEYFASELGQRVRAALLAARGGDDI